MGVTKVICYTPHHLFLVSFFYSFSKPSTAIHHSERQRQRHRHAYQSRIRSPLLPIRGRTASAIGYPELLANSRQPGRTQRPQENGLVAINEGRLRVPWQAFPGERTHPSTGVAPRNSGIRQGKPRANHSRYCEAVKRDAGRGENVEKHIQMGAKDCLRVCRDSCHPSIVMVV